MGEFFDTEFNYINPDIRLLTILRYPGGKSKIQKQIIPHIMKLITNDDINYYEPFTGGASIALTIKYNFNYANIHLNDLNYGIYKIWQFISTASDSEYNLLLSMLNIDPDMKLYNILIKQDLNLLSDVEIVFNRIVLNRISFGGIIGSNPIGGKEQKSKWKIDCVYGKNNIVSRMNIIRTLLSTNTHVTNYNALDIIRNSKDTDILYLDPPYYEIGKKYYDVSMTHDEHKEMADILRYKKNFVLSINDLSEVRELYSWAKIHKFDCIYNMKTSFKNGKSNIPSSELIITNE